MIEAYATYGAETNKDFDQLVINVDDRAIYDRFKNGEVLLRITYPLFADEGTPSEFIRVVNAGSAVSSPSQIDYYPQDELYGTIDDEDAVIFVEKEGIQKILDLMGYESKFVDPEIGSEGEAFVPYGAYPEGQGDYVIINYDDDNMVITITTNL